LSSGVLRARGLFIKIFQKNFLKGVDNVGTIVYNEGVPKEEEN
jgi:hypothetical protein